MEIGGSMKLGKKIGYIRVSSVDQNPERQLEGLDLDKSPNSPLSEQGTRRLNEHMNECSSKKSVNYSCFDVERWRSKKNIMYEEN